MGISIGRLVLPDSLLPMPFPLFPLPRGLVRDVEGLDKWEAMVLRGNEMESLGIVWAEDEAEAIGAAENLAEDKGPYDAVKVVLV